MRLTGSTLTHTHTLTVERIIDVPELHGTPLHTQATTNTFSGPTRVIVERRDGLFVAHHGADTNPAWSPYVHIWDEARHLAARRGLRYVGPDMMRLAHAAEIREDWHVRLGPSGTWHRVTAVYQHINLATLRRTGQIRYRKVTISLEGGSKLTKANADVLEARPHCAA